MQLFALNDNTLHASGYRDEQDGTLITDALIRLSIARKDVSQAIQSVTPGTPISVTSTAHGLVTGNQILITQVVGTLDANGVHTITRTDADHFTLQGSASSQAAYPTTQARWYQIVPGCIDLLFEAVAGQPGTYRVDLPYSLPFVPNVSYLGDIWVENYGDRWSPDITVAVRKN